MDIKSLVRTVPHFPHEGIMFRDVTTLFKDSKGLQETMRLFKERYESMEIDVIAGVESRGFITGAALAVMLGVGFVPIRKKGKLPAQTISVEYELEYGTDVLEIHTDAITKGQKVLVMDDLLATGGTALGAIELVEKLGGEVIEFSVIVDLPELKGIDKLQSKGYKVHKLMDFEGL